MKLPNFISRAAKQVLNATTGQSRFIHPVPASWRRRLDGTELILAAGMPRSASTWLYNAARLLLRCHPDVAQSLGCGWVGDLRTIPKRRLMLIKLHEFDPGLVGQASKIIYSTRDISEALASTQRKFGHTPNKKRADSFAQLDKQWTNVADFVMCYEEMLANKTSILEHVARVLSVPRYDSEAILRKLEELDYSNKGPKNRVYHEENLFHRGHRTTVASKPTANLKG